MKNMNFVKKLFYYKSSLKLLMYFFQVNGLLAVNLNDNSQRWRFLCSKKIAIFSIFVVTIFHFLWSFKAIDYNYIEDNLKLSIFERMVGATCAFYTGIAAQFLRVLYLLRREESTELSNKIKRIRAISYLLNNSLDQNYKQSMSHATKFFLIYLIFLITIITMTCLQYFKLFLSNILPIYLNRIIIHSFVLQYTFFLLFLKEEFKAANEILIKVNYQLSMSNTNFQTASELCKLQIACKLHSELYGLSRQASQFFSLPTFLSIFSMFLNLLIHSFALTRPLVFVGVQFKFYLHSRIYTRAAEIIFLLITLNMNATLVIAEVSNVLSKRVNRQLLSITFENF